MLLRIVSQILMEQIRDSHIVEIPGKDKMTLLDFRQKDLFVTRFNLYLSNMVSKLNTTGDTNVSMQEESDEQQEVIEVQILHQVRQSSYYFSNRLILNITFKSQFSARELGRGYHSSEHELRPRICRRNVF